MSQFFSQSLNQQMRLEQRLTPQLIQSMAILQKPVAELEAYIENALESNAALEVAEVEAPAPTDGQQSDRNGENEPRRKDDSAFERMDRFAKDQGIDSLDRGPMLGRRYSGGDERDAKMGAMANTEGRQISLHEHLLNQWSLAEVDKDLIQAGELIIDNIDPDGYLKVQLDSIVQRARPPIPVDLLERALKEIQQLDPPGIGARDAVECLLLQIDFLTGDNRLERMLVSKHLDDITHNRLPAIAKASGCSIGEINEAIKAMRSTLCLHPGYLIGDRSVPSIRPDVIIEYADSGGGLNVRLARGNAPQLRIRQEVAALARSKSNGKSTRDFARKHVEAASALIDAVTFRRSRLLDVAYAVVEKQCDFFDIGPEGLKICRMSDLATELGCDPSTVSRTVADKYVQTPRGIYPLRYFFTGGTETESGESMGWDRVKTRVRELIEAEDKKKPFNDDQIAALLKKEGIEISRRTVAKYRQQLDIPAARQRREF